MHVVDIDDRLQSGRRIPAEPRRMQVRNMRPLLDSPGYERA